MSRALWVMTTITYGALVICAWGFIGLVLDADVVAYSDAGPLLGPAMAVAATLAVGGWIRRASRPGGAGLAAVGAAASSWFAMLLVGAIGYTLTRGSLAWLVLFAADYATSAFTLVPAVIAALLVAGVSLTAKAFARRHTDD